MRAAMVVLVLLAAGCGKKPAAEARACRSAADCEDGWVCLAGTCADPRSSAAFTDPAQAVTPGKVGEEIKEQAERHEQDLEDRVDRAEQQP